MGMATSWDFTVSLQKYPGHVSRKYRHNTNSSTFKHVSGNNPGEVQSKVRAAAQ
jgi:hypothetical protein